MASLVIDANEKKPERIAAVVHQLTQGRVNAVGTVTLTPGSATTVVQAPTCAAGSIPDITPMSASAATEFGAGAWWVSAVAAGTFTITHTNSGVADRLFGWKVFG